METDQPRGTVSWDVLHLLKADPSTAKIPVILFSWLATEEQALSQGADAFVQKPVMFADFMDALALVGITNNPSDLSTERR
jgi:CheY-like chemotaxis protein